MPSDLHRSESSVKTELVIASLEGSPHYVGQGAKNETAHHKLCQCCKLAQ